MTPKGTRPAGSGAGRGRAAEPPSSPRWPGDGTPGPWNDPLFDHEQGFVLGEDVVVDHDEDDDSSFDPLEMDGDPVMSMIESIEIAASYDDPMQVELWAAELVGNMRVQLRPALPWEQPALDPGGEPLPDEEEFFGFLAAGIGAKLGGPDHRVADMALHALIPYLPDEAAVVGRELAARTTSDLPDWFELVGAAVIEESFSMDHETDDGHNLALVARYPGTEQRFLVMLLVDVNMGRLGKDILISDAIDEVRGSGVGQGIELTELPLAVARARIEAALAMTDMTIDAPVADDFDELRPILERLLASMPEPAPLSDRDEATTDEFDAMVERLVSEAGSSEAGSATAGSTAPGQAELVDLRMAAHLMCSFCADRVGVDPLAWSPTRLEIFLLDHVPRKVAAPPEELLALPELLKQLVPAAHRGAGWADRYAGDAITIIDLCQDEFRSRLVSPEDSGPAKAMMMRAIAEGLDLDDPEALHGLIDRVNEMGGIDVFGAGDDLALDGLALDGLAPEHFDESAVPDALRGRVAEIDDTMVDVALELFDPELLDMSRALLVRLANEHPDELAKGHADGWAGGIPYAIGQINKVFASNWHSDLTVQVQDLVEVAAVSQATLTQRAKRIRTLLDLDTWPPPDQYFRQDARRRYEALNQRRNRARERDEG